MEGLKTLSYLDFVLCYMNQPLGLFFVSRKDSKQGILIRRLYFIDFKEGCELSIVTYVKWTASIFPTEFSFQKLHQDPIRRLRFMYIQRQRCKFLQRHG
jgi:hypothetical protein